MGLKVGYVVRSCAFGLGVVRDASKFGVCVEFIRKMGGHDCGGVCKDGHGWHCVVVSKKEAFANPDDDGMVYKVGEKEGEWE